MQHSDEVPDVHLALKYIVLQLYKGYQRTRMRIIQALHDCHTTWVISPHSGSPERGLIKELSGLLLPVVGTGTVKGEGPDMQPLKP